MAFYLSVPLLEHGTADRSGEIEKVVLRSHATELLSGDAAYLQGLARKLWPDFDWRIEYVHTRKYVVKGEPKSWWNASDDDLVSRKLREASRRMREKILAARRRVKVKNERLGQGEMGGYYVKIIDSDLCVVREYLEDMERAYEEVHLKKGGSIDAQFIRTVLQEKICNAIKILSDELIAGNIRLMAKRTRFAHLTPVLRHLDSETNNLEIEFRNRYEIEVHELGLETSSIGRVGGVPRIACGRRARAVAKGQAMPRDYRGGAQGKKYVRWIPTHSFRDQGRISRTFRVDIS